MRKKNGTGSIQRWAAGLLGLVITILFCFPALSAEAAETEQPRVVRVAFPQTKGLTETAEDGSRSGLVVDYLNEIAKYTGWEYEYVDADGESLTSKFLAGEFELMGGTYYSPGFEQYFAYPDYNTGYSKSVLLARSDSYDIRSNDLESLNGKTIGVYENAKENIRRLKEFLSANALNCTLEYFSYEQLVDGKLYTYLDDGEIDLLLGNIVDATGFDFRVVASFDSQPLYIVTNVGNQEILDGLNMAMDRITSASPNFGAEHYAAHFPEQLAADIQLTEEELDYVQYKGTVTVAVVDSWHPLFCLNSQDESHRGLLPDLLDELTDYTGLKFSYVYANTYADAIRLVQDGKADILGFFLGDEDDAAKQGLALTAPYVNVNSIIVRNKSTSYPGNDLVGATIEGRQMPADISASEVRTYPDIKEALFAVNRGEVDFMYGLSVRMERDIQKYQFNNVVPVTIVNDSDALNFALPRPVDPDLLTILNKAINSLSDERKTELLNRNMISVGLGHLSLIELIRANPFMFFSILVLLLMILVIAGLWTSRARMRAAVMQSNLEKAQAESRAKSAFLSRMSHEIRTPMNAIVGLSDLTGMLEDVPGDVRDNLSKIRASSHYLLDLINDILDMSRIDSGMLSVASESFSLKRTLEEVNAMMESEAGRRGLVFTLEDGARHADLVGDAIRLRQVLINLLSNAFKFTPSGGNVTLRVTETAGCEANATFRFEVIDSGTGISQEDQERIFDAFEQVGPNLSKSQGTGLGLPISRNIVQLMGGDDLHLESEPGRGSKFYFTITLPLGEPAAELEESDEKELLKGSNILLAEDNDLNAEIAVQLLQLQGASVCRSENGKQAVERFQESGPEEFQLILMDIRMPEMNGLEAARAIRAMDRPDARTIPIVAMTANSFQEDVDAAMEAGMNEFLSKPLDVSRLYSLLNSLMNGTPGA